jgi:hypothetical protein
MDRADIGPIEERGDVVAMADAWARLRGTDTEKFTKFFYIWALREPEYIRRYMRNGFDLSRVDPGSLIRNSPIFLPNNLIGSSKPDRLHKRWNNATARTAVGKLVAAVIKTFKDNSDPTLADQDTIIRRAKEITGIGVYGSAHFFRQICLLMGKRVPGDAFFVMGSGASSAQYDRLIRVGLNDMREVNRYLPLPRHLDAGEFAYYICMAHLFQH